jgi:multidrug resistance protein MdtO
MATAAQSLSQSQSPSRWLWEFLKEELAPYPGRVGTVARMTFAATLIMIVGMTFHIPYIWQGAVYALMVSRENTRATLQSAAVVILVTDIGAIYLLVSVWLVINFPLLHFLWIVGTFFIAFYAVSALTNYIAAVAFINLIAFGIPLWDRYVPAETNVDDTLWLCLSVLIAIIITGAVEVVFARLRPGDGIVLPIAERLTAVGSLLTCYAADCVVDRGTRKHIIRLQTLGTSLLRRTLRRSDYSPEYSVEMGGVIVLVGRLVDLAATLMQLSFQSPASDQRRLRDLASTVAAIRNDLMHRRVPRPVQFDHEGQPPVLVPLLAEMEYTVSLIPQAFADSKSIHEHMASAQDTRKRPLLALGTFANPEHLQFALKGCLAATICYVIYNAVAWPGISTAVTTCLLTALSTVGSSRQKQVLRITGAIVGGFLIGMGAQVFILPYLDSIAGLVILFVAVTAFSSWFMTSSPRLSYFGIQVALAFYLIHLSEFKMQTSLEVARDRVVGVLLGLIIMWLVFDQLWGSPAAVEMRNSVISTLRLLAQLAREPVSKNRRNAIAQSIAFRDAINTNLDKVRALADAVLFEFGPSREQGLRMRDRIRRPDLRMLFITRIALWKYRVRLPGFELPEALQHAQEEFDQRLAAALTGTADRMEGKGSTQKENLQSAYAELEEVARKAMPKQQHPFTPQIQSFLLLSRRITDLADRLTNEM